jgi:allantoate deiminase
MRALAEKAIRCCRDLSAMSEEPGRTTRTFLSPPMKDVHERLGGWMREVGMEVRVDAAGNLRGLYGDAEAPRLLIGSHLDTVPDAGAFDGVLGVVLGIALIETRPRMSVEVIGFSEEEGVRFGFPFIGSRALTGTLGDDAAVVAPAIREFGLDPSMLDAARFSPRSVGYLEFHIEQGPVLESLGFPLGVVEGIVGQSRCRVTFTGKANHAGTTPMKLRHDALAAAAEWIGDVEKCGVVATVGSLGVMPNAVNAIAGRVVAGLDVRDACDAKRREAAARLIRRAEEAGASRGVTVTHEIRMDQPAVPLSPPMIDLLNASVEAAGYPVHRMTSGAGHDAMIVSPFLPSAMLFLRSPGGVSHHPDEDVLVEDVEAALEAGARFVEGCACAFC